MKSKLPFLSSSRSILPLKLLIQASSTSGATLGLSFVCNRAKKPSGLEGGGELQVCTEVESNSIALGPKASSDWLMFLS